MFPKLLPRLSPKLFPKLFPMLLPNVAIASLNAEKLEFGEDRDIWVCIVDLGKLWGFG